MLIIGTVIGAGFASGREIVSFFGASYISPVVAIVCGVLLGAGSFLFLAVGTKYKARNVSDVNARLMGRLHPAADLFLLFNSLIVLAGMLAGFDSLGNMLFPLQPLYSIVGAVCCAAVVYKGVSGLVKCNTVLIPAVIGVIIAVCALRFGPPLSDATARFSPAACLVYASMNLILAATVLSVTDVGYKTAAVCSVLAGIVMTVLMLLIIFALNANGAEGAMPLLGFARKYPPLFYTMAAVVAAAIFTTMLTAASGLTDWLTAVTGDRKFSLAAVLLAGLILSNLGFEAVVSWLYPVIGILGAIYISVILIHLARPRLRSKRSRRRALRKARRTRPAARRASV